MAAPHQILLRLTGLVLLAYAALGKPVFLCICAAGLAAAFSIWSQPSVSGLLRRWVRQFDPDLSYAHALSDSLLLDVAYCASLDALWRKFEIILERLGFAEASLESARLCKQWQAPEAVTSAHSLRAKYRFGFLRVTTVELVASRAVMEAGHFNSVSLVAAKAWVRAADFWKPVPERVRPPDATFPEHRIP
jgi:hypothetical protein